MCAKLHKLYREKRKMIIKMKGEKREKKVSPSFILAATLHM